MCLNEMFNILIFQLSSLKGCYVVNGSIIHYNDGSEARKWRTSRQKIIFNEFLKNLRIDSSSINVAGDIAVNCHGWEDAIVLGPRTRHSKTNNFTFWTSAMSAFSSSRIDARFIQKYKLISSPSCQSLQPSMS